MAERIETGVAGASAAAEYERRRKQRADRVQARHPYLGGVILALTRDPQTTNAWAQGSVGEQRVGARLDTLSARGAIVLHDRRIPGTKANIDHIVVASSGIWVIDTKRYRGRVTRRRSRSDVRLSIAGRDATKLVVGVQRQVAAVERVVKAGVAIHPVLCFTDAQRSLFARPFEIDGILVLWPRALVRRIASGAHTNLDVETLARRIADVLPPAPAQTNNPLPHTS